LTGVRYIGADVPREDGREKSTGAARYATDFYPEDALHVRIVRSRRPHARIRSIRTENARRAAGVETIVTGRDYPDFYWGTFIRDQTLFAVDKVRYVGQPVAALAGGDGDALAEAGDLIEIEYEDLPAVFNAPDALSAGAPILHEDLGSYERVPGIVFPSPGTNVCNHFKLRKGNVEEGFDRADFVFEDAYRIPMVQHCPMEPHACVARFETGGKLTLHTSTQGPHLVRKQVAEALRLDPSQVRVVAPYCGGGFGGKISAVAEVLSASVALKLPGRPVRLIFDREEEFGSSFVRQEFYAEYKTGVMKDGVIMARRAKLIWDAGAYGDYEASVARTAGANAAGPYRIPNVWIDSYCVYTNKPVAGAFRGFGVSEVCFAYEQQLDRIAAALGMDPLEIRMKNAVREGDEHATGQVLKGVGLDECLRRVSRALGAIGDALDGSAGTKRRGRGIACMTKSTVAGVQADAEIVVREDGSVLLKTSAMEHGQGAHTVLRQMAAEELGCDVADVVVDAVDTDTSPYTSQTSASKTTFFDGNAVRMAAAEAKRQLLGRASRALEADPEDLSVEGGRVHARGAPGRSLSIAELVDGEGPIVARESFKLEDATGIDPETGQGKRPAAFQMYAAQGAEIEVDIETGRIEVLRLVAAHDVGRVIHPRGCEGQIEGALIQGVGTALFEELRCEDGAPVNGNLGDYKIPCALDAPRMGPILVEAAIPDGPWGAKGVGEPGLVPTAAAIGNAFFSATGRQLKALPFIPEKVLAALGGDG